MCFIKKAVVARVVFLGGFRKCKQLFLLLCWFLQAVFVPGGAVWFVRVWVFASGIRFVRGCLFCHGAGFPQWQLYAAVFVVRCGLQLCSRFGLSGAGFLQAVLGSCGAAFFVVVWVSPGGSCTQLFLWFGAVCSCASRLVCPGLGFCKRY